jgi:hypothetical protein
VSSKFFVALAVDYDGTLAREGRVDAATIGALEKIRKSGRKLILVTGRELTDLQRVFPEIEIFDLVVAENGARFFLTPRERRKSPWRLHRRIVSSKPCGLARSRRFRLDAASLRYGNLMKPWCSKQFAT